MVKAEGLRDRPAGGIEFALGPVEALEIYRRLAEVSPEAYEPYVATKLNNIALLFNEIGKNEEALASAREALETYGRCAERNQKQFEANLKDVRALVERLENA